MDPLQVWAFLFISILNLTMPSHQSPLFLLSLYLPPSLCLSTFDNWCCWLTRWLVRLCHAGTVTFDILARLPKMSANYLPTIHHFPSVTSQFYPLRLSSCSSLAWFVFSLSYKPGYEKFHWKCEHKFFFFCIHTLIQFFFSCVIIKPTSFLFFIECSYSRPADVEATGANMTG